MLLVLGAQPELTPILIQPPVFKLLRLAGVLMIRLLTAVFLFASFHAVAQTQVPNVFEDGTPAKAAEVNANFDALETAIDAIPEGPAGPQGVSRASQRRGEPCAFWQEGGR